MRDPAAATRAPLLFRTTFRWSVRGQAQRPAAATMEEEQLLAGPSGLSRRRRGPGSTSTKSLQTERLEPITSLMPAFGLSSGGLT